MAAEESVVNARFPAAWGAGFGRLQPFAPPQPRQERGHTASWLAHRMKVGKHARRACHATRLRA